jgi:hypothetical protein
LIFEKISEPFDFLVIKNTFSEDQLFEIWNEIDFINEKALMEDPTMTGSAVDENFQTIKNNTGAWLNKVFENKESSSIHKNCFENFFNEDLINCLESINPLNVIYRSVNNFNTLISYYDDNQEYGMHTDQSAYTINTYLFREPRCFSGGEIVFQNNDFAYEQQIENNMTIIFPSATWHSVNPVKINNRESFLDNGRYCISNFLFINSL